MNLTEAREMGDDIDVLINDLAHDSDLTPANQIEILGRIANRAGQEATRLTILQAQADGLIPSGPPGAFRR